MNQLPRCSWWPALEIETLATGSEIWLVGTGPRIASKKSCCWPCGAGSRDAKAPMGNLISRPCPSGIGPISAGLACQRGPCLFLDPGLGVFTPSLLHSAREVQQQRHAAAFPGCHLPCNGTISETYRDQRGGRTDPGCDSILELPYCIASLVVGGGAVPRRWVAETW